MLSGISTDYYARLEQQRGPQPSEQVIASLARGLRLSLDERDHLLRLAGHHPPTRVSRSDHVSPGLLRVLDRLDDTPAQVVSDLGETLVQNRLAAALLGDQTSYDGLRRSQVFRWFTEPASRRVYPQVDHERQSRLQTAALRAALTRRPDARAHALVHELLARSEEFAALWDLHEVADPTDSRKRICHPELGEIEVDCGVLHTADRGQALLVFTPAPGAEDQLALLAVVGRQFSGEQV